MQGLFRSGRRGVIRFEASPAGRGSGPPVSRVTVRGNRFDGIAVDAIQAKNFRDLLVEDNEFSNVRRPEGSEAHPDVLQTVHGGERLTFRRNYLHDYDAQGLFIKDGR